MNLLILIALRNLFRQKRRNLLLGAAIAVGMAILVTANAFSHGISDVLFNRILAYMSGNISVSFTQNGNRMRQVFRDGDRMRTLARGAVPGLLSDEEAIGVFARAIGNGRTDNAILIGMDVDADAGGTEKQRAELRENFRVVAGRFEDLKRRDLEHPILLAVEKAKSLNVQPGDAVRVRFQDVNGQNRAARLTVAGIFQPANVFMTTPIFLDLKDLKNLAGYGPHDIGQLYLMLPDPKKNAVRRADDLHAALKPPLAAVFGRVEAHGRSLPATALGFRVDSASLEGLRKLLPPFSFPARPVKSNDVFVGKNLADSLGLKPGDRCSLSYAPKYGGEPARAVFAVSGVLPPSPGIPGDVLWVNDKSFYAFYYANWPEPPGLGRGAFLPDSTHPLFPLLCREWLLLDRTHTTEELQRKFRLLPQLKTRAVAVDVATMYETASMVIKLEYALNLITLGAVLILFFIIQVGVVNTLRMTIRERTREIGTMRAIGMRKNDLRGLFLLETFFLSLFACAAGVALAFAAMALLRQIPFHLGANPMGMLLVNNHLHFKPNFPGAGLYLLLILGIAVATAWFPARKAANLPPSEALRHFG